MLFLLAPVICFAEETGKSVEPLKEAYIQYRQVGWQTYEFYVLTNGTETTNLTYELVVNDIETFNTEKLRYFFRLELKQSKSESQTVRVIHGATLFS